MTKHESLETLGKLAVVGMTCRFPGARNTEEFWRNLRDGKETIHRFTVEELLARGANPGDVAKPDYVKAGGVYEGTYLFDAGLVGYTPREAELLDPQHRVLLECAWEALENAGYPPVGSAQRVGVFAGAGPTNNFARLAADPAIVNSIGWLTIVLSIERDFLATRIGYTLNLKGPCLTVQTACSTSLVAIVLACQSLLTYQSDVALAGGISLDPDEDKGYFYEDGGILSPDGHCRTFDASARGTVPSSGAGMVVLKRLSDALADHDSILAVVLGYGLNNDGSAKVGFTAPSVDGQVAVSSQAIEMAGINPETISYVECHGTATHLGDPIEISALTKSFRAHTNKKSFCAVGSAKSNIGHTVEAAGVAGFIKTVLALKHKQIPPTLHFQKPNPEIDFANSPFFVNSTLSEWRRGSHPRRAAVSSFGIGGTNAHVILEEAPAVPRSESPRPAQLLTWSAKTPTALETMRAGLQQYFVDRRENRLADVAYTLQVGRSQLKHRSMLVARDWEDALTVLEGGDPARVLTVSGDKKTALIGFLFPGQGSQYVGMAKDLYRAEAFFRHEVDRCARLAEPCLGYDLRSLLYPPDDDTESAARRLAETAHTQPALFVTEYALARLWMKWGLQPDAMIGHSVGEYVAACLAGVFSLEDGLRLIVARAGLMQGLPPGAMLSVQLEEDQILPLLGDKLSLAAINGPTSCVLSGPLANIELVERRLVEEGVPCGRLHTSHAFHSAMMDPILESFGKCVRGLSLQAPKIPYISNLTGDWISPAEAVDPDYWIQHLRSPVRFSAGVSQLCKDTGRLLLEVGPGRTLTSLVSRHPAKAVEQVVLPSLPAAQQGQESTWQFVLTTLGRLWQEGVTLNWKEYYAGEERGRIPLPTYPFERSLHRIQLSTTAPNPANSGSLPKKNPDVADWLYQPSWKRLPRISRVTPAAPAEGCWLIFLDECGLGEEIAQRLEHEGHEVIRVTVGQQFASIGERRFTLGPGNRSDYDSLVTQLRRSGRPLRRIVHLWGVTRPDLARNELECLDQTTDLGFYSLLYLTQAVSSQCSTAAISLYVIVSDLHDVAGETISVPSKATVLGPCRIIGRELRKLQGRCIDVSYRDLQSAREELVHSLLKEFTGASGEEVIAYRGGHRWTQTLEKFWAEPTPISKLRNHGVYVITGGMGGIGLVLAEHLARAVQACLVLFGRSPFPPREAWDGWLASHSDDDRVSGKIQQLRCMEEAGAKILIFSADVGDLRQTREVFDQVRHCFGAIHGVIHAAGVAGDGVIELKTRAVADQVLRPKVRGTLVLEELLRAEPLDFFILFSSTTAILGDVGQVDYTGANAFLDAFAHARKGSRGSASPVSVNWDRWKDVGLAAGKRADWGILPHEGVNAFDRILSVDSVPQTAICPVDLNWLVQEVNNPDGDLGRLRTNPVPAALSMSHPRPMVATSYVAPRTDLERNIAEIWQALLGISEVGVYDDFMELGGNSLMVVQLASRMRELLEIALPANRIYENPTVAGLAKAVVEVLASEVGSEVIEQALKQAQSAPASR